MPEFFQLTSNRMAGKLLHMSRRPPIACDDPLDSKMRRTCVEESKKGMRRSPGRLEISLTSRSESSDIMTNCLTAPLMGEESSSTQKIVELT